MPPRNKRKGRCPLDDTLARVGADRAFRMGLTKESHLWFFMTYLRGHMTRPFAPFHKEIFRLTESCDEPIRVVAAFRNSGKSTIASLSYPVWAALTGRKKFILVVSKTETQAKQILYNIKAELESNAELANDYGPFNIGDVWNESSLALPRQGARIVALSAESSLRGLKNLSHRPDLIIVDDVEDLDSVRSGEVRDRRYRWLKSEAIPAGSDDCTVYVVGNLLHEDSLVARLRDEIEKKELNGVYRQYPIVANGRPTWPAKFPTLASIEELKRKIGDQRAFRREYMLEIVAEADQVVPQEWVRYYDRLPDELPNTEGWRLDFTATGVDLAISQRETADYTAMVPARVYKSKAVDGRDGKVAVYVLPNITNRHLTFDGIIEAAKLTEQLAGGDPHHFYVEDVAFQRAAVETLKREGLFTTGVNPGGMDKRSRLTLAARQMELGRVYFPRAGCEDLIRQIVGFGRERNDDLCDAFSLLVLKLSECLEPEIWYEPRPESGHRRRRWPDGGSEVGFGNIWEKQF